MRKLLFIILLLTLAHSVAKPQCPTTNITGNLIPANGDTLSGTYNVSGDFIVSPGVTIHVRPLAMNGCGVLEVIATGNISIGGTISANGAGHIGGAGGAAGVANNAVFIETCSAPTDLCADIVTFGGGAGLTAFGNGGGLGGNVGNNGGGRKDRCLNFGDEGGRAGAGGGAGAGAGGSYGGNGRTGGLGGGGSTPTMSTPDVGCTSTPIVAGNVANGGAIGATFGTTNGLDIDLGAGGAGAGGGGRGRFPGTAGANGGNGGGMVRLMAAGNFTMNGIITANGLNGGLGGNGGSAGASSRCCVDACNGVDEYTHTGAGGGGGGGGGGSGGGVYLEAGGTANITGVIVASGANGAAGGNPGTGYTMNQNCFFGNSNASCGPGIVGQAGGAGSGGRIKVFFNPCANSNAVAPIMTVNGGSAGFGGAAQVGTTFTGPLGGLALGALTPSTQTICYAGDPSNLNSLPATGGAGAITYQWQYQPNCTGSFSNIIGATGLNYDPPSGLTGTTCYRLEVQSGSCIGFADTLTVNVNNALNVTVNPTGPVVACLGDSVPFTTSGGAGATYQWFFNGAAISGATDSFLVATASGNYTVQVDFPIGCPGTSTTIQATFAPPPAAFAVVLQDTVYCPGHPVNLLAVGNGNFQWLLGGVPIPGANSANFAANGPGMYAVEVSTPGGCTAVSDSVHVIAGAVPSASLLAGGVTQFCSGDSVVLNASGGVSYEWLLDGQPIPNANGANLPAYASGNYQVIAIGPEGCTDTTLAITVLADPIPIAQNNPGGPPVNCVGDSVEFFATGGTHYQWLLNGSPLVGDTLPYFSAILQGDYSVIVSNDLGCTDTSVVFAFSFYPPIASSLTANGSPVICPGDSLLLLANGAGSTAWTWHLNDTLVPNANGPQLTVNTPGSYTATAYDAHGCHYTSAPILVLNNQRPNAEISVLDSLPVCRNEAVELLASGGGSYQWLLNGQIVTGETDSVLWVSTTGNYQVVATSTCGIDTAQTLFIEAGVGPIAGFEYDNYPMSMVQLRDMSISGASWWWDFGDGTSPSTEQNPLHQFPNPGEYNVTMITWDVYGCSDTISILVIVTDPDFFIPNVFSPNGDGINDVAQTNFKKLDNFTFSIFDRWGKRIFQTETQDTWWDGKTPNGNDAPDGVYFYALYGEFPMDRKARTQGPITLVR